MFLRTSKRNFVLFFAFIFLSSIITYYYSYFILTTNKNNSSTYRSFPNSVPNYSDFTSDDLNSEAKIISKHEDLFNTYNNTINSKNGNKSYNTVYDFDYTDENPQNKTLYTTINDSFPETRIKQTQNTQNTKQVDDITKTILKVHLTADSDKNVTSKLSLLNCTNSTKTKNYASDSYIPFRRLVHFDLKGAPPKMTYLLKLLPVLKKLGATGLLIEYEDMFPYEDSLKEIAALNHYTKNEIESLLNLAKNYELEVIPLVQTFGHLEFVLKLENYRKLREDSLIPQSICPSQNKSLLLIKEIIDQVVSLHPDAKWIHIGCDEVFQLGTCPLCRNKDKKDLFLQHVVNVASYVREKYHIIPIVWDDMLHRINVTQLQSYNLGNLVEPMMWTYISPVYYLIGHHVWNSFAQVFSYIWGASAFKGAFGPGLTVPNVKRHLENNLAWLETMNIEESKFCEIRGLVLTGWQRYDHFATLCELLPTGIPSLAINLLATSHGYFNTSLHQQLFKCLNCTSNYNNLILRDPDSDNVIFKSMGSCFFPGVDVFNIAYELKRTQEMYRESLAKKTIDDAWITDYNIHHNFSNAKRIKENLQNIHMLGWKIKTFMKQCHKALQQVYDENTAIEWIEQNIYYPMLKYLIELESNARSLLLVKTWPVRPLQAPREIIEMAKESRSPIYRTNEILKR